MKVMMKKELIEFLNKHVPDDAVVEINVEVFVEDYQNMMYAVRIPDYKSEYRIDLKFNI